MRKRLRYYFSDKRYLTLAVLAFFVLIDVLLLVFTPYEIHDLVVKYRIPLMWLLVCLLAAMFAVCLRIVTILNTKIEAITQQNEHPTDEPEKYNFYDEKGELRLSARPETVYYLEAADNYVVIHYLSGGKMDKIMIRNSLKNLEWRFRNLGLVRCHRSYIVNLSRVQLLRRQENEVFLDFGDDRIPSIPVSKSYGASVMDHFTANTSN